MQTTTVASELQRQFYLFFRKAIERALHDGLEYFPPCDELTPDMRGALFVRAFMHITLCTMDASNKPVISVTREAFLSSMASHYDQTVTDIQATLAVKE